MIDVAGLSKTYQVHKRAAGLAAALRSVWRRDWTDVRAVQDVTFSIAAGERVGFLGPNGAGKTTTLKMLSGLLHPTAGTVRVDGFEPARRHADFLGRVTLVMGQKQQLLWDLPPVETFELNRAIYNVPRQRFQTVVKRLVDLLDAADVVERPTRNLSLGERMKCELIASLVHEPKVLFLDEPTIGLDVTMQEQVRRFIRSYNDETGATILLTSHHMEDVRALCPRVLVIDHGRLVHDGPLDELAARVQADKRIRVRFHSAPPAGSLQDLPGLVEHNGLHAVFAVPAQQASNTVRQVLERCQVADLAVEDPPLDQVMREVFRRSGEVGVP